MKKTPKRPRHKVSIQRAFKSPGQPERREFIGWVETALANAQEAYACVIRIVDEAESAALNAQYRHKDYPTNVLSFPFEWPDDVQTGEPILLGDLVVCAPVVEREAREQQKILAHHWAHLIVHGLLHLLGYDHIEEQEADEMEAKEIAILAKLHIQNPYEDTHP